MNQKPFWQVLQEEVQLRSAWTDTAILEELKALPVLPDEYLWQGNTMTDNPAWETPEVDQQLTTYLVLAQIISDRKLRAGVPLLLERASYGDMGETMRGLRHSLEAAYHPDWDALNDVCLQMAQSPHRGGRLWAMRELGVLRDERSLPTLIKALQDSASLVQEQAVSSLTMLCQTLPGIRAEVLQVLESLIPDTPTLGKSLQHALASIRDQDDEGI